MTLSARIADYGAVSTALTLLSDQRLAKALDEAQVLGTGIGGAASLMEVEGVRVFVKRIRLADVDRENALSTANLFGLPAYAQYGVGIPGTEVGSPGFNVWREVAANVMTTNWVLDGSCPNFPLTYHWRVVDGPEPTAPQLSEVDETVEFWHGSTAVRSRLEAKAAASSSVVLFQEYLPTDLTSWLETQDAEAVAAEVERQLRSTAAFMNTRGLHHFDAHFGNLLTDGRLVYFADLGLATSTRFELSSEESSFVRLNASHDEVYVTMRVVNWLVQTHLGLGPAERNAYIRRCAEGVEPELPPVAAEIVKRNAPVVAVMNEFYWGLFTESRLTPYPASEIAKAGFTATR
ncbi:hypothetical protein NLX83_37025 [Allokutzneria sp. A3M-2-11 16]|uniref:hypothetical protein n=1 Tax=Allokutzneria sp. A3M-2-11 16 TaxID=2962043 RepID=UPI0020B6B650|nr:hypothetical protein [Allokutzneria sp. A3M-2-11 16]MCP3804884.1 hypothetical protein [Allokutzneria sp. A3M-2-11 16]